MSTTQIEIIWTDRAGGASAGGGSSRGGAPPPMRTPRPEDRGQIAGPSRSGGDGQDRSSLDAFAKAGGIAADAVGLGGFAAHIKALAASFQELYQAVMRNTAASKAATAAAQVAGAAASAGGARAASSAAAAASAMASQVTGPKKTDSDVFNGAFKVLESSTRALPNASPVIGIPGPVATMVETLGVTGPRASAAASAVTGPAAGAGGSAGAMTALSAAAGPLAVAFATTTAAVLAGGLAAKRFSDSLHGEAERLSGLSGPLASTQATNMIRQEFADLRRAQSIGPGLSRFEDRRGRGNEALAELWTKLLGVALKVEERMGPIYETLLTMAKNADENFDAIEKGIEDGTNASLPITKGILDGVLAILGVAKKDEARKADTETSDPFMDAFISQITGKPMPPRPPAAARPAAPDFGGGLLGPA